MSTHVEFDWLPSVKGGVCARNPDLTRVAIVAPNMDTGGWRFGIHYKGDVRPVWDTRVFGSMALAIAAAEYESAPSLAVQAKLAKYTRQPAPEVKWPDKPPPAAPPVPVQEPDPAPTPTAPKGKAKRQEWIARYNAERAARDERIAQIKMESRLDIKPILDAIPKPAFDPTTATPEEWEKYNASLSEEQRAARRISWAHRTLGQFKKQFPIGQRDAAHRIALNNIGKIYCAFDAGQSKENVVSMLNALYNESAQRETPANVEQKNGPAVGPV